MNNLSIKKQPQCDCDYDSYTATTTSTIASTTAATTATCDYDCDYDCYYDYDYTTLGVSVPVCLCAFCAYVSVPLCLCLCVSLFLRLCATVPLYICAVVLLMKLRPCVQGPFSNSWRVSPSRVIMFHFSVSYKTRIPLTFF